MSVTIRPRALVILGAALAVLAGGIVYGIGQDSKEVTTGQFSVSAAEATSIEVRTVDLAGNDDPAWASCSASGIVAGQVIYCRFQVHNQKTSGPILYSVETTSVDNGDGLGLAGKLVTTFLTPAANGACGNGEEHSTPIPLSGLPRFGNPAPGYQDGDHLLAADEWEVLCVRFYAMFGGGTPYGATTSATFRVVADDEGLE